MWNDLESMGECNVLNGPTKASDWKDLAAITLTLLRKLIKVVRAKSTFNIEAGLQMIALAMAISSEVRSNQFLF